MGTNYQDNISKFRRGNPLEVENTCIICGAKFRDTDPKPTCGSYRCLRAWGKRKKIEEATT